MNPALKNFFRPIRLVYWTVLAGMTAMLGAAWMIGNELTIPRELDFTWLNYAAPLSGMAFIILGERIYRLRITRARALQPLAKQIAGYREAVILRMMIFDGAALVLIAAFAFSGNFLLAGLAAVIIFMYLLGMPTALKMVNDLKIEGLEREVILGNDPDAGKEV